MDDAAAAWRLHGVRGSAEEIRCRLREGTIPSACRDAADASSGKPALCIDGESVTHDELDARAGRAAAVLRETAVDRGDRVLLCAPSSVDLVAAYLGVLRLGAVAVLASPALTPAELCHLARDSGASVAVAGSPGSMDSALGGDSAVTCVALDAANGRNPAVGEVHEIVAQSDEVAVLAYTSGTTGLPKGAPLTHANLLSSIRGALAAWEWSADDVLVHALPLTHQHGLSGVHAALASGSTTVVLSRFDPAALAGALREREATVLFGVPTMYQRLLEATVIDEPSVATLRLVVSGSAPLPVSLFDRIGEAFGRQPLERYGTTESGLNVSNPYRGRRRASTVGLPLPGVEVAIVDAAGSRCAAGTTGEVVVRGPQVFAGYWNRTDDTDNAFLSGAWFRTGDIGVIDAEDGYVQLTGRARELIISGGMNVYPREVELALEEHPLVRRAAVVGMPSSAWGEEVWALVVADGGAVPAGLDEHLGRRLASYKRPKRVLVVHELPETSVGKLARREIRELAARMGGTDTTP